MNDAGAPRAPSLHAALRAEVTDAWARASSLDATLKECVRAVLNRLGAHVVRLWEVTADGVQLAVSEGAAEPTNTPLAPTLLDEAMRQRRTLVVDDVQHDSRFQLREWLVAEGIRSFASRALVVQGRALGVLSIFSRRAMDEDVLDGLETAADLIALGMDRTRSAEALRRSESRMRLLVEASAVLGSSLEYEQTLRSVARMVVPAFADWCSVHLTEGESGLARQLVVAHIDPQKVEYARQLGLRYPPDPTAPTGAYAVIRTGKPELFPVITDELLQRAARDEEHLRMLRDAGMRSAMIVPLTARGRTFGAITFVSAESGRLYDAADLEVARELADRAAHAVDNARLYRDAQEAVRVRDDFLSIASHELKTPLTPLHLHLDSMRRLSERGGGEGHNERLAAKLEAMSRQVDRLDKLINELLEIGRLTAGRFRLECEEFDLVDVARDVSHRFAESLARAGCLLELDASGPVKGCWDRLRLEQVLTNLITNAMKFGQGKPIRVGVRSDDGYAVLTVRDQGIGISEEDQARIFERFERAVPSRHYGGFGLGLWIVRQIVEAMGGTVQVQSELGRGSTFTVEIPRMGAALQPRAAH